MAEYLNLDVNICPNIDKREDQQCNIVSDGLFGVWLQKLGSTLYYRIKIHYNVESDSYWAESSDLTLTAYGKTIQDLIKEVHACSSDLLEGELPEKVQTKCFVHQELDVLASPSSTEDVVSRVKRERPKA